MNFKQLTLLAFAIFLALCIPLHTAGQIRTQQGNQRMAETSDLSGAVKAMNSSVDLASGTGTVEIPVFELKTNDFVIPINLTYQTTGIKITDLNNGPFGMGWNMTGVGRITRVIRGSSDIRWPMEFSKTVDQVWREVENPYSIRNYESDLYYFETPTLSGLFILGADMQAIPIPYQNIDIQWNSTDNEDGFFTIRDTNGNEYVFGKTDLTRENTTIQTHYTLQSDPEYTYTSTWHLDEITSIKGEKIKYSYTTAPELVYDSELTLYNYRRTGSNPFVYASNGTIRTEAKITQPKILARIAWGTQTKVEFNWYNGLVSDIVLSVMAKPSGSSDERVYFSYTKNSNGSLLSKIKKGSHTLYAFDYFNATDYAYKKAHDWWGYYNKTGDVTNIPSEKNTTKPYAPDKSPKLEYARYHTLRSITLPDGGRREFVYELNDGYTSVGKYMQVGGLRVAAIETIAETGVSNTVRYEYKTPSGESSGVLFADDIKYYYDRYEPSLGQYYRAYADAPYNELFDVNQRCVTYAAVRETNGATVTEYQFSTARDANAGDIPSLIHHFHRESPGHIIIKPDEIIPNIRPFHEGNIDFYNTSRFWRRGLMKRKQTFDTKGNLLVSMQFAYDFGETPKLEITNYQYYCNSIITGLTNFIADTYVCAYKWLSEPVVLKSKETLKGPYTLYSKTRYTYDMQHLVQTEEEITDCNGNVMSIATTYPFSYETLPDEEHESPSTALRWLKEKRIAAPVETVFKRNGRIVKAELNEYQYNQYDGYVLPYRKYELNPLLPLSSMVLYDGSGFDAGYKLNTEYCCFDYKGRLTSIRTNGTVESVLYEEYGTEPIAKVKHAVYNRMGCGDMYPDNQVFYTSFESDGEDLSGETGQAKTGYRVYRGVYNIVADLSPGTYCLTYWTSLDRGTTWNRFVRKFTHAGGTYSFSIGSASGYVDEVRIHPERALMETFSYLPYRKKYTESDYNGKTIYTEYDEIGRVVRETDDEHNIVSEYEYNTVIK